MISPLNWLKSKRFPIECTIINGVSAALRTALIGLLVKAFGEFEKFPLFKF